jgi:hypothetical protein
VEHSKNFDLDEEQQKSLDLVVTCSKTQSVGLREQEKSYAKKKDLLQKKA